METGSVLSACWIQLQARSIKELNLDFTAEIIATGTPRTLWQGSRGGCGWALQPPSLGSACCSLIIPSLLRGTNVSQGHNVGDPGRTRPPAAHNPALTSPSLCFSPENIPGCGKSHRQQGWGTGGAESPWHRPFTPVFSAPQSLQRVGSSACPALTLPTRTGRAGAAGRDSSHRVLPAGRARGLIKVRGCCQQRERGSGG